MFQGDLLSFARCQDAADTAEANKDSNAAANTSGGKAGKGKRGSKKGLFGFLKKDGKDAAAAGAAAGDGIAPSASEHSLKPSESSFAKRVTGTNRTRFIKLALRLYRASV